MPCVSLGPGDLVAYEYAPCLTTIGGHDGVDWPTHAASRFVGKRKLCYVTLCRCMRSRYVLCWEELVVLPMFVLVV